MDNAKMSNEAIDLLLINPGGRRAVYQDLADDLAAVEPPLWCRLIAGYVHDKGWRVRILDADAEGLSSGDGKIGARLESFGSPRLVAIIASGHQPSASTQTMPEALALAEIFDRWGEPCILVGGHVAALPVQTLEESAADFICTGEGPITINELLHELVADKPDFTIVRGLGWRHEGGIKINPPAPLLDVRELHGNAWDLLPMRAYRAHNWQVGSGERRQPYASIYTSLGCPFKCSFCCINAPFSAASQGGNRYRMRDPAEVAHEIHQLYWVHGVSTFKITDEMFVLNERHVRGICERLAEFQFAHHLNIWAYARVDTITPGLLPLMRRAGIRWLALGIESASEHVRDGSQKHLSGSAIRAVVKLAQSNGIKVIGNFIFGLPDDTHESMRETLDLAMSLDLDFANFYSAMAYPGSQLHGLANPRDLPRTWSGYSQHSYDCTPLPTATVSAADVLRFRDEAHATYFTARGEPELASRLRRKLLEPVAEVA
jgi:radical SAM superfamily enzyme YgiQ (UPF0313 family)